MRRNLTDEEIEIYFSMKLSDSLPENELAFLNKLIEEDPELKARWLEFCEHFREEDIDNSFAKLDDPGLWSASKIIEQTEVRSNLRPLTILILFTKHNTCPTSDIKIFFLLTPKAALRPLSRPQLQLRCWFWFITRAR
jgi:hypothetical protein